MEKGKKSLIMMTGLILIVIIILYIVYLLGHKFEGFVYDKF